MYLSENAQEKWKSILDHGDLPEIKDNYRKQVTAVLLENQEKALREEKEMLTEAAPANSSFASDGIDRYDPILIGLVRRAMPNLMAYDICGVQPMSGPTGLIFAMRSILGTDRTDFGNEALFNEANTNFSAASYNASAVQATVNPTHVGSNPVDGTFTTANALTTATGEALGDAATRNYV